MPDTSPEAAAPDDGIEHLVGDGGAEGRGALDVPEWVSELRRLYVEPKTRASLRQQGGISPQKRKLGLPGGRASRRGTAPTESPAPDSHDGQTADAMVVAPPPLNPEAPLPAPLEPVTAKSAGIPCTPKVARGWSANWAAVAKHPGAASAVAPASRVPRTSASAYTQRGTNSGAACAP